MLTSCLIIINVLDKILNYFIQKERKNMELLIAIATIFIGFLASSILGGALNWSDAGAIVSTAFMGGVILWKLNNSNNKDDK